MKRSAKHKETTIEKAATAIHAPHHTVSQPRKAITSKKMMAAIGAIVIVALGLLLLFTGKSEKAMEKDTAIVAKVNNIPVYAKDVEKIFAQAEQQGLPYMREQIREQLIAKQVLLLEAKKQDIKVTEEEISGYTKNIEALLGGQDLDAALEKVGITKEEFQQQTREQLIISKLLKEQTKEIEGAITEEDLEAFYKENENLFVVPEQVNASHILVKTEKEAKEIIKELEKGKDFAAVAKEKSIDPSAKQNGGNLGFFGAGQMVPEFEKAAFALDINKVSEPVKSQFGYHVMQVHEKRKAGTVNLAEVKEDIKQAIINQQSQEKTTAYISSLVEKATIEKFPFPSLEKEIKK